MLHTQVSAKTDFSYFKRQLCHTLCCWQWCTSIYIWWPNQKVDLKQIWIPGSVFCHQRQEVKEHKFSAKTKCLLKNSTSDCLTMFATPAQYTLSPLPCKQSEAHVRMLIKAIALQYMVLSQKYRQSLIHPAVTPSGAAPPQDQDSLTVSGSAIIAA